MKKMSKHAYAQNESPTSIRAIDATLTMLIKIPRKNISAIFQNRRYPMNRSKLMVFGVTRCSLIAIASQLIRATKKAGKPMMTTNMNALSAHSFNSNRTFTVSSRLISRSWPWHHQVYVAKHIAEQKADNCGEGENQHPVKRVGIGPGQNKPATRANRFVTTGQKANGYKQITFMADDPGI